MKTISIKGTTRTPNIEFNPEQGKLEITGRSQSEHVDKLYSQLILQMALNKIFKNRCIPIII